MKICPSCQCEVRTVINGRGYVCEPCDIVIDPKKTWCCRCENWTQSNPCECGIRYNGEFQWQLQIDKFTVQFIGDATTISWKTIEPVADTVASYVIHHNLDEDPQYIGKDFQTEFMKTQLYADLKAGKYTTNQVVTKHITVPGCHWKIDLEKIKLYLLFS